MKHSGTAYASAKHEIWENVQALLFPLASPSMVAAVQISKGSDISAQVHMNLGLMPRNRKKNEGVTTRMRSIKTGMPSHTFQSEKELFLVD